MFLGIDLGTSAVKTCLMAPDLSIVATASEPLSHKRRGAGLSEQDPHDWWHATVQAVRRAAAGRTIQAIGLAGQMHGFVLLDDNHRPLRDAILWDDQRGQTDPFADLDPSIAGAMPSPSFTASKLAWLAAHETLSKVASVLQPKDWLGLQLHGGIATDASDAAGTWLFDQSARTWSSSLCEAAGVPQAWLAPVHESPTIVGHLSKEAAATLNLEPCPIVAGAGDTPAGALAAGVIRSNVGLLSIGTSGQIFVPKTEYVPPTAPGLHSFAHCLPGLWYHMAALQNGGRPLAWLARVTGTDVATLLDEAAQATGPIPLALPYLAGERTPLNDPDIRGAFYGMTDGTTRGQMGRAMIEAIAYGFAEAAAAFGPQLPPRLRALGGGTRSDFVVQTIADATGHGLDRVAGAATGAALGAARLAALGTGAATVDDLVTEPAFDLSVTPNPIEAERHLQRRGAFRAFYHSLESIKDMPP